MARKRGISSIRFDGAFYCLEKFKRFQRLDFLSKYGPIQNLGFRNRASAQ